jgi:hypothetical protein
VGSRDKDCTTSSFMTRIKLEIQRENISLLSIPSSWLPKNTSAENSEPCRELRLKNKIKLLASKILEFELKLYFI